MEVEFEDRDLEAVETDPRCSAGHGVGVDRKFRQRMGYIRKAKDERDFYTMKSLHFEKLQGGNEEDRSMRLNDQWRLIVRLRGESPKTVVIVGIRDYH